MKPIAFLSLLLFVPSLGAQEALPVPQPQQEETRPQFMPNERVQGFRRDGREIPDGKRPEKQNEGRRQMEQRQAQMEKSVRDALAHNGVIDVAVQDAILQHIAGEARARGPLRGHGRRLLRLMQNSAPKAAGYDAPFDAPAPTTDEQITASLSEYLALLKADSERREAAEAVLDARIGWSKNPRLHALLLLFGAIGDSPLTLPLRAFTEMRPQRPEREPRPEEKPELNNAPEAAEPNAAPAPPVENAEE
ncbi:MAG TPA: hypothetical protein VF681_06330 [Abditibacteriaceae bacterium]|jgi:hypothetical protein